jgi:hypothetical protein
MYQAIMGLAFEKSKTLLNLRTLKFVDLIPRFAKLHMNLHVCTYVRVYVSIFKLPYLKLCSLRLYTLENKSLNILCLILTRIRNEQRVLKLRI